MQTKRILNLLLLTGLLTGCWTLHIKDETPETLGNIDLLQSFIGQKSESVVRELGVPDELLSDGDKQFMVYSAKSSDTGFLVIMWLPVWAMRDSDNVLHCLRIELDSDNLVKEYQIKSKVRKRIIVSTDIHFYSNCQQVFWMWEGNWKEPIKLQKATEFPSTWVELDTDFQLAQFKEIRRQDTNRAFGWLCKSADSGNQEARVILAEIYHGGHPWIKTGIVERNDKLAYVWYALSGTFDKELLQSFADIFLTSEQQLEAKTMLEDWQPGNCERDLGLTSNN